MPTTMSTSIPASAPAPTPSLSLTDPSNQTSRPSPPSRQRSSSLLLHKNVLSRLRPLPFQYVFSFWHTKPLGTSTSTSPTTITSTATSSSLSCPAYSPPTLLAPTIPDIATFYKIYNNFPWASLPLRNSVHFFRSGVEPLWEDQENLDGGCWVLKVRRDGGRSIRIWEELCLLVLGGELQTVVSQEHDHILGITYSPRLYTAHISIWTKQGGNRRSVEALQRTVLGRLSQELRPGGEGEYYYRRHCEHEGWTGAVKASTSMPSGKREEGEGSPSSI